MIDPAISLDERLDVVGRVKCVVWDLDETMWSGTLLDGRGVAVQDEVVALIRELDARGLLNSVASRNDHDVAFEELRLAGIDDLFLYPQISWDAKSSSIAAIAAALDIGIDSIAFVDDQQFELDEVAFVHPEVVCVRSSEVHAAASRPAFNPRFITDESRQRREMYRSARERDDAEREFGGTNHEFLATLGLRLRIGPALESELRRAEELTVRTNQLNSTGRTYDYEELLALCESPDHLVLVARLEDAYGTYGTIGLALVEKGDVDWRLALLIMSCRVVSRGVGTVFLNDIMRRARDAGAGLVADFVETGRNRMMYVAYMFAGFEAVSVNGTERELRSDLARLQAPPDYMEVDSE